MRLQHGAALNWAAVILVAMFVYGVIVTAAGLVKVAQAARSSGFWNRTPGEARWAFIGCCYWLVVFLADVFLSANLRAHRGPWR